MHTLTAGAPPYVLIAHIFQPAPFHVSHIFQSTPLHLSVDAFAMLFALPAHICQTEFNLYMVHLYILAGPLYVARTRGCTCSTGGFPCVHICQSAPHSSAGAFLYYLRCAHTFANRSLSVYNTLVHMYASPFVNRRLSVYHTHVHTGGASYVAPIRICASFWVVVLFAHICRPVPTL